MAHGFIAKAERIFNWTVVANHQRVAHREMAAQARGPNGLGLFLQTKCSRRRNVRGIVAARGIKNHCLTRYSELFCAVVQVVGNFHSLAVARQRGDHGVIVLHNNGLTQTEHASRRVLFNQASFANGVHKWKRAAVAARQLWSMQTQNGVVNAQARKRAHAMFNGVNGDIATAQRGATWLGQHMRD